MSQSKKSTSVSAKNKDVSRQVHEAQKKIGYTFNNISLLKNALTHGSVTNVKNSTEQSYQRLEFLGDRILGVSIATLLFKSFPNAKEGELSKRYTSLVNNNMCSEVARELKLQNTIITGIKGIKLSSNQGSAILADVCEAIIAAIYLDSNFETAFKFVKKHWQKRISPKSSTPRDPKTALQEFTLKRQKSLPKYDVISRTGEDHRPTFKVKVQITGFKSSTGVGQSIQRAEQNAAKKFLKRENIES